MRRDGKIVIWAMLVVFVISIAVSVTVFQVLNDKVTELEVMKLDSDDWIEVCYEYETVNRSKIVDPADDGCWDICDVVFECEDLDCGISHCYQIAAVTISCTECIEATEPYIYTWQETSCARIMLSKEGYGDHK